MTRKILIIAVAAACALALVAAPAQATGGRSSTIVTSLVPDFGLPVTCPVEQFGFGLRVASVDGTPVGTGQTCIREIVGCDPFEPYCLRVVQATLTLFLTRGSLTAQLKLGEVLQDTEASFVQIGTGTVSRGTGAYAGDRGRISGGGHGSFDDTGTFTGTLVYAIHLTHHA